MPRSERTPRPATRSHRREPSGLRTAELPGPKATRHFFTRALGDPPGVYGERVRWKDQEVWRPMEPSRTKLGAALARGLTPLPLREEDDVLYLGAATGTTPSHVADLVGPSGVVYAIEKSPRAFLRLLSVSRRWPNLAPLLRDATRPWEYLGLVSEVDALYADISHVDQTAIVLQNARFFLREGGTLLFAVKLSSMGRELTAAEHVDQVIRRLAGSFEIQQQVSLEPFHKKHVFLTGRYRPDDAVPRSGR